jgi:hypothetical protein
MCQAVSHLLCHRVKALNVAAGSGARIALGIGMNYEKMKAFVEASREQSAVQRNPDVKEFPKQESRPGWEYLDAVAKEQMAA